MVNALTLGRRLPRRSLVTGGLIASASLIAAHAAFGADLPGPFDASHFLGYATVEGNNARAFIPHLTDLGVVQQGNSWVLPSITCLEPATGDATTCTYVLDDKTTTTAPVTAGSSLDTVFSALKKNVHGFATTTADGVIYGPARIGCYSAVYCVLNYDTGSYQHSYNVNPAYAGQLATDLAEAGVPNTATDATHELFVAEHVECSGPEINHRAPDYSCTIVNAAGTIQVKDPIKLATLLDEVQLRGSLATNVSGRLDAYLTVSCDRLAGDTRHATCSVVETIPSHP